MKRRSRKFYLKIDETILYVCTFVRIIELSYSKINPSCRDLVAASLTAMAVSPECRTLITEGSMAIHEHISLSYGYMRYLHIKRILRRVCVILCTCLLFQILRISTGDYKMATHFRQSNYRKLKTLKISREDVLIMISIYTFRYESKRRRFRNDKKLDHRIYDLRTYKDDSIVNRVTKEFGASKEDY
ncbi:hypothetical protein V1477_020350 [Vespula maculifrons]|uniref:Uncharacterized protein n=1 Tax=Vespula maculifrons TaxID=7453 RepID=A0ABD2ALW7_VESMC